MTHDTPQALRTALESRIRNESAVTGLAPDRLCRRVVVQRIVTRLQRAEPGRWVLKGGMGGPPSRRCPAHEGPRPRATRD